MKLAVAVLSSILAVCSVTVANPVDPSESIDDEDGISTFIPSATTSTEDNTFTVIPTVFKGVEYNFWIDANPDGIGLGALDDPIPDDDSLKYYIEIRKTKLDHEKQLSKLDKIRKSFYECQSEIGRLTEKKWETDQHIVSLVFGTPLDLAEVPHQTFLIRGTHSVKDYIEQQLLKYKDLDRNPSDQEYQNPIDQEYQNPSDQQCQDSQSSLDTLSGSGSFEQKVPSKKRKGFSKLMSRLGSFFQQSKRDDPSN
ncbi:hypothetical protein BDEG_27205 [Batrachochytrium dendrobatidis JEL423]|uniref:Uncharacterized protein n=1 Tax=Batrachochytrium dendrobatidis (strain JEL423) TaxID=403673 RepID=A0A177WVG5_BATDL|nr:hypothetical protein BDEG_27205 [Batrachochytrium dendrobatidis JEL423]